MSSGVRETKCTNCEHRNVCMYKTKYVELLNVLSSAYNDIDVDNKSIFRFVDPDCNYYKPTIAMIR